MDYSKINYPLDFYLDKISSEINQLKDDTENKRINATNEEWIEILNDGGGKIMLLLYLKCIQQKFIITENCPWASIAIDFHREELNNIYSFIETKIDTQMDEKDKDNVNYFINWHNYFLNILLKKNNQGR